MGNAVGVLVPSTFLGGGQRRDIGQSFGDDRRFQKDAQALCVFVDLDRLEQVRIRVEFQGQVGAQRRAAQRKRQVIDRAGSQNLQPRRQARQFRRLVKGQNVDQGS